MIIQGLKPRIFKRLEKFRARWVTELLSVLWSLRTTLLTVKIRQPSHAFTFGVGISFIPYPLVLTPVV
jgi:hypothetical protein